MAKSHTNSKILFATLLIVLAGGGALVWHHHSTSSKTSANHDLTAASSKHLSGVNYSAGTAADNAANDQRKGSGDPSQTLTGSSTSTTPSSNISIVITRAAVSSNTLDVATLVSGTASGSCTFTISQAGKASIIRTETVQLDVNNYDCPVLAIPLSDFPGGGAWNIHASLQSGSQSVSTDWSDNPVELGS